MFNKLSNLLNKKSKVTNKGTTMPSYSNFVALTRVYKMKDTNQVKTQPISIAKSALASVRPSNRLGDQHRATLTTLDGQTFEVAQKYSDVKALFGIRA